MLAGFIVIAPVAVPAVLLWLPSWCFSELLPSRPSTTRPASSVDLAGSRSCRG
jgi:hypothetical protein